MARDDFYASPFGVIYSAYMRRPALARAISRLVWGGDPRPYYDSMAAIGEVREGGTVVDCPCGAGAAFRGLNPHARVRYAAVDLSPSMLARARARATAARLEQVELIRADAVEIPLPSACADLFLSYWGLHCFDDPGAAVREAARVLAPGGRLVGSTFLRGGDFVRQRLLIRPGSGDFGRVPTAEEAEGYLRDADLDVTGLRRSGPLLFFDARRPQARS